MERDNISILKSNNGTFVAIEAGKIVNGYLHDTYDIYGGKRVGKEKATYYNFFNGSEWCSLILQCEALDCNDFSFVDDDLADHIFTDFNSAKEIEEINGIVYFEGEHFNHSVTRSPSSPFWFESNLK